VLRNRSTPAESFAAPVESFGAPVESFGTPVESFGAPVESFGAAVAVQRSAKKNAAGPTLMSNGKDVFQQRAMRCATLLRTRLRSAKALSLISGM
jgi:hypothetical protein